MWRERLTGWKASVDRWLAALDALERRALALLRELGDRIEAACQAFMRKPQ